MPYKGGYHARIAAGLARGLTKSQAGGHAKPGELPAHLESLLRAEPLKHSLLARAKQLGNPTATESVKRAYAATRDAPYPQNPLVEKATEDLQAASRGELRTPGTRGLVPSGEVKVHVTFDKISSYGFGGKRQRFKVFDSRGRIHGSNLSKREALALAEDIDPEYDAEADSAMADYL